MGALKFISKNSQQTKEIGKFLGQNLRHQKVFLEQAFVIALWGNLGAGKTTFVQGLAEGLGVKEKIKSPSFAILKIFELKPHKKGKFNHLLHFDFYRLEKPARKELEAFNFYEFLKNPQNLIIAEWSERIKNFLPRPHLRIEFQILKHNKRELIFSLK